MIKKIALFSVLVLGFIYLGFRYTAGDSCCSQTLTSKVNDSKDSKTGLSGCTPSNCRGAKTKFGEAKVITDLRSSLIELKADMESHKDHQFDARSYDIHRIVGNSDEESLDIIAREVEIVEKEVANKLDLESSDFMWPEEKAKQIQVLQQKIEELHAELK